MNKSLNNFRFTVKPTVSEGESALELSRTIGLHPLTYQELPYNPEYSIYAGRLTPEKLSKSKPGEALKLAVKRMLPGGVLGRKQLTKLKIYTGNEHPHSSQNPKVIDLAKLNSKNIIKN